MRKTQELIMNPAENNDFFTIGSTIKIVDCHKESYKGTVRSFDYSTRILSMESPSSSVAHLSDIYIFNLDYVADIEILDEKSGSPEPVPNINVSKISQRLTELEKQKTYIGVGVSPEGQRLMNKISKTIGDCKWHKLDIVILDEVTIKPPYGLNNLECIPESKALPHIKKIVEKHYQEEAKQAKPLPS